MEKERNDGNTILLTVIGVATLLVALVGATFAYFSTQVKNDAGQSVNLTTAAPVGLSYLGKEVEMANIIPGNTSDEELGKFTVTNPDTSTVAQRYDLKLIVDENTLNNLDGDNQLLLTITSGSTGVTIASNAANVVTDSGVTNGVQWDMTNGKDGKEGSALAPKEYLFVDDQRIEIGATHEYQLTLNFVDTGVAQDNNQGKTFRAHVEIADVVSVK